KAPIYASSTLTVNGTASLADITATGTLSLTGTTGTSTIASGQGFTIGSGSTQFTINGGNRFVGIGTSTPRTGLHYVAPATFYAQLAGDVDGTSAGLDFIAFRSTPANNDLLATLRFQANSATSLGGVSFASIDANVDGTVGSVTDLPGRLSFFTTPDGSATLAERMRITNVGLLGIGTTSPTQLLSVQGNALISGNISSVANITATGTLSLTGTTGTSTIAVGQGLTIGTSQFVVDGITGNVGIATSSPFYGFTVATNTIAFNAEANGTIGVWATSTTYLPDERSEAGIAAANGFIYAIAGLDSNGTDYATVYYTRVKADGTLSAWSTGSSLPVAISGVGAIAVNGYLYALGGTQGGGTAEEEVYYTKIHPDGSLGTWRQTTNMAAARIRHSVVSANGYMYVIGGQNGANAQTGIFYSKINSDGTLGPWQTNANSLSEGRREHGSIVANGYVYVFGGHNSGAYQTTVSYARLNADGSTGSISTTTALPVAQGRHGAIVANGYVYIIGGTTGTGQSTVYFAKLNANGTIGAWNTNINALPTGWNSDDTSNAVIVNGYIYLVGGWNSPATVLNSTFVASTARTLFATHLDLIGLASSTIGDFGGNAQQGSVGSSLLAGNIYSAGNLEVNGGANFWSGLNTYNTLSIRASSSLQQNFPLFSIENATGTESLLTVQYDGRIGIGTSTPNWRFQITGSSTLKALIALSDKNSAADLKHWTLSSQGGNFYVATSSDAYATSSLSALTINSDSLFGLATTSPSANHRLSVQGSILGSDFLTITGTASSSITTALGIASTSPWGNLSIEQGDTNIPIFVVGDQGTTTPIFVINPNRSIGIGVTSPTNGQLEISGMGSTGNAGASVYAAASGSDAASAVFKSVGTSNASAYEGTAASGYAFEGIHTGTTGGGVFSGDSTSVTSAVYFFLRQRNSTFVGDLIRTDMASASGAFKGNFFNIRNCAGATCANASHTKFLMRADGVTGFGTSTPQWDVQIASSTGPMLALSDTSAGVDLKHWTISSQGGNFYIATSSDAFATSTLPALMINSDGKVGIGTTTLLNTFSVQSPAATGVTTMRLGNSVVFNIDSNGETTFTRPNALSTTAFRIIGSSGGVVLTVDTSGSLVTSNGGFQGGSNVNSNTSPTFSTTGDTNTGMYFPAADNLGFTTGGVLRFGINQAGFLGKGTSTPRWDLQVASSTGPKLTLSDTSAGDDLKHWTISTRGGNFYVATSSDTTFATSSVPALMIDSNGMVGIGTSSPTARLSIEGRCVAVLNNNGLGCSDVAELYPASEDVLPGDILAFDASNNLMLKKATSNDSSRVMGIVSTDPAIVIEGSALQLLAGSNYKHQTRRPAVALSGRVPVKASTENGVIQIGDPITLSSESGVGKKATQSGRIVGYALETYSGATSENEGKVLVFVNLSYWLLPESLTQSENTASSQTEDPNLLASLIEGVKNWLKDGLVAIKNLFVEQIQVGTTEKPAGVTLFDEITKEPYCIKINNGQLATTPGVCETNTPQENPTTTQDTETPVITLLGPNSIEIEIGTAWADPGATVTDSGSPNIGIHYQVDGVEVQQVSIDTSIVGTHTITYTATDQAGNTVSIERTVIVSDPQTTATTSPEQL
ncbi:MAG TPA: immunoglobulin-like domain-containing protein, partial [Candidatus Paceibacterota bacterium]